MCLNKSKTKEKRESWDEKPISRDEMDRLNAHCTPDGKEFLDNCRLCGSKIRHIREGSFFSPKSDITECDCLVIEHENSCELMGNTLHFGNNKILKVKYNG